MECAIWAALWREAYPVAGDYPEQYRAVLGQRPTLASGAHTGHSARVSRPILKQFAQLSTLDFERSPVWIACHVSDYDESWYDDTDEETFRPYSGELPADADEMLLVAATATLNDGSVCPGFLTPAEDATDLGRMQPHMFADGVAYGFWGGTVGIAEDARREFLTACRKNEQDVFPIRFVADPAHSTGVTHTVVVGWL